MAEKNFNIVPTVSISRSKFLRQSGHKTSFNLGDIVPIYVDEVLPGDTRSIDVASLIRMSTPIAPIMDDIVMEFFAFFVPNRLVWSHWKQFMGESDVAGYNSSTEYTVPQGDIKPSDVSAGTLADYFGLPYGTSNTAYKVDLLIPRGYVKIYNRWFRNQNVEGLVPVTDGDSDGTGAASMITLLKGDPLVAYKKPDYFTTALPYAQKGAAISLPLGTYAPVVTLASEGFRGSQAAGGSVEAMRWRNVDGTPAGEVSRNSPIGIPLGGVQMQSPNAGKTIRLEDTDDMLGVDDPVQYLAPSNLWADLGQATAATINDIRLAFCTQKALEKDALYGSRYWEILYGHFGVKSPDASLQDPEYLGGSKCYINVDQVLQTTGYDDSSSSELAKVGANSVTGMKANLFTKSFCEHGHIFIMAVARQKKHTYAAGLNRMWSRQRRFDYYLPVFANLGNQEIRKRELSVTGGLTVFGYQEAWAEYRYKPSITTGILNPNRSSSLDYWTLTDEDPTSSVTLSSSFLKETRDNIERALTTGSTGPDFIADFLFNDVAVRPMPMYSIPGLIDHH